MEALNQARRDAGLSVSEAAAYLGRSQRTWRRWRASGAPRWAIEALRLRAGILDALGWKGWKIHRGEIYAPDLAGGFAPADLYRAWWDRQLLQDVLRAGENRARSKSRPVTVPADRPIYPLVVSGRVGCSWSPPVVGVLPVKATQCWCSGSDWQDTHDERRR
jgi:hypothetical protein